MMNSQNPPKESDEELYRSERNAGARAAFEQTALYDRAIMTLGAGGIGVSILFVFQITPGIAPTEPWLLLLSWSTFAASLLVTILSFRFSARAFDHYVDSLESLRDEESVLAINADKKVQCYRVIIISMSWISGALFIFGTGTLIAFAFINLNMEIENVQ